jgi:hypothetical protein
MYTLICTLVQCLKNDINEPKVSVEGVSTPCELSNYHRSTTSQLCFVYGCSGNGHYFVYKECSMHVYLFLKYSSFQKEETSL